MLNQPRISGYKYAAIFLLSALIVPLGSRPLEVEFNWEPVSGADRYVIEISETPDFRKLILSKTVFATGFIFKAESSKVVTGE